MTTINESFTAKGYTPASQVPAVFGQPRTIEGIVIHHWGATGQKHQDVVDFFCSTGPGETSAHFVVSAGRIDCLVSPLDAAWHCPGKNATHIGIECHPEATDADYATVAELVNFLRGQYGPLPLSMHRTWYSTACPGIWDLPRIDRLAAGSAAIAPQSTTITPQEADMPTIDEIFNHPIPRAGGQPGVTTLGAFVAYWDANNANTRNMINAINPYVHSIVTAAVTQILGKSVTVDPAAVKAAVASAVASTPAPGVDPAAIAKAVNDDAASRRQNWK